MAEKIGNFILELVAAPGVGTFTLGTPVAGRLPWSAGVAAGLWVDPGQVYYFANDTVQQEWGYGTYKAGQLTRDVVLWTSAGSTTRINFATLPVYVYPEIPAERTVYRDPATGRLIAPYDISSPTQNQGPLAGHRNRLINGAFSVNQRNYASGVTAPGGTYMHDRWKAGVSGCAYSYTQSPFTQISITLGTLQQVIDAGVIEGGTYTLSWQGNAVARIDTGAYAVSPLTVTGLAAGAAHTVEFNTGTMSLPQFETGAMASQFEVRHAEQLLCNRYFVAGAFDWSDYGAAGAVASMMIQLPVQMRGTPNLVLTPSTNTNCGANALTALNTRDLKLATTVTATGAFRFVGTYTAGTEL